MRSNKLQTGLILIHIMSSSIITFAALISCTTGSGLGGSIGIGVGGSIGVTIGGSTGIGGPSGGGTGRLLLLSHLSYFSL